MLKTSLVEILKTFSSDELKKFDDFINSPYFNKKTPVINLWKAIKKYSPNFDSTYLNRKIIYAGLFPDKDFNYGVMKNIIFDLTRLAENFIVNEIYQEDEFYRKLNLLYGLEDRDLSELHVSKFESIEKTSHELSFKNNIVREDYYLWMWKLFMDKWNFNNQFMHSKNFEKYINQSSDYFLAFILIKSFIIYHNIDGQKVTHNSSKNLSSIEIFLNEMTDSGIIYKLISSLKPNVKDVSEVLEVYHKMFLAIKNKNSVENYFEFKNSLKENADLFSLNDLKALYITLSNCLGRNDYKEINRSEENLEIYEFRINNDLLITNEGKLWDQEVIKYISSACNMERADLLEKFIDNMENKMQEESKENLLNFGRANIYFVNKDFEKALEIIAAIKCDIFTMKFYVKNLQLRIYYELNEYDPFSHSMDSYKHFLRNNKYVSDKMKNYNMRFCDFIEKLFEQKENFDEFKFNDIKKSIYDQYGKDNVWILRKVKEIELKY